MINFSYKLYIIFFYYYKLLKKKIKNLLNTLNIPIHS